MQDELACWQSLRMWPDSPPFTGGVLDAWPSRMAEAMALCRQEWVSVMDFIRWEARQALNRKEAATHG